MGISITHQTQSFFLSLVLGAVLGLMFDGFRILRLILPSPRWLVSVEDVLYCICSAIFSLRFMLIINQGEVRSFILVGEVLGWILYLLTLSPIVLSISKKIIKLIYCWILHPISFIFFKIIRYFQKIFLFLEKRWKKLCRKRKFTLKRQAILLYNLIKSKKASSD